MSRTGDADIQQPSPSPTFAALVNLAEAKLGSRAAVLQALNNLSRQRLHSVLAGGPPLRAERLLSLALATDIEPSLVLQAGGRATLAKLLDRAYDGRSRDISPLQRALLRDFERLPEGMQQVVAQFVTGLATIGPSCEAASRPSTRINATRHEL